jgi:hypothetical protein
VSDHDTVWYRRNLILGYSFCSNRCATQWKQTNLESKPNNSNNSSNEDSPNGNFEYGNFTTKPKQNNDFNAELNSIQNIQNHLRGQKQNNNSDQESAKKIMFVVRKILPHWKIILPITIVILSLVFYLNTMFGQILSYLYVVLIIGAIWAYFTEAKD